MYFILYTYNVGTPKALALDLLSALSLMLIPFRLITFNAFNIDTQKSLSPALTYPLNFRLICPSMY